MCGSCPLRVAIYTEDAKTKLCDTGNAEYFKLMMVSVREGYSVINCEKSVDPTGTTILFP